MKVSIVLPGIARKASGGHKVVYGYANFLAAQGHSVELIHAKRFVGVHTTSGLRGLIGSAMHVLAPRYRPSWFAIDPQVAVRNSLYPSRKRAQKSDIVIATATQTAPFVAAASEGSNAVGAYFIQHFENWAASTEFVESTWKLPLYRIVIAPWLVSIGNRLSVETRLVPNAIDPEEFPAGPPISARPLSVLAMVSDVEFKRADLICAVFKELTDRGISFQGTTFGVGQRPELLPAHVRYVQSPSQLVLGSMYRDARVYLCASDAEGWHLPPAEAMASGAALVSTEIGGVVAYAEGVAKFAPVGDAESLTDLVANLLEDGEECERWATAGKEKILAHSPSDAGKAFEAELYRAVSVRTSLPSS